MRRSLFGLLVVGTFLTAIASADDASDEAINKDRKRISGRWQIVALEINGNKTSEKDAKKLAVVNGSDGTWSIHSDGKEISRGTSIIDPTSKPKTIDFTPTNGGGKGNTYLGIYELGGNKRKLCFAPPGSERPKTFSSESGSQNILVAFQRVKTD